MSTELSTLPALLNSENIKKKFKDVLGDNAAGFMSSILSAVNSNPKLKSAEPMSVISAAAIAAALDLPINSSLAYTHIVPYKSIAQFQMGWKGYVQLAQRTGLYLTINVSRVCEGELISENPFKGEINLSKVARVSDKIIGYVAYFKLLNGFEKYLYMTKEQCEKHGKRYSDSYNQDWSWWQKDFDVMAMKTVIKALLSKWGPLSIKMQLAFQADQSTVKDDGTFEYVDNEQEEMPITEKKKGIAGLKSELQKKIDSPTVNQNEAFEKKYFDLLAAINDSDNVSQLINLADELKSKEMPAADVVKILGMIETKKKELKK